MGQGGPNPDDSRKPPKQGYVLMSTHRKPTLYRFGAGGPNPDDSRKPPKQDYQEITPKRAEGENPYKPADSKRIDVPERGQSSD